jgi:hypothetical protein
LAWSFSIVSLFPSGLGDLMPFGLDLKSVLVGALFAMFVWPLIMQFIGKVTTPPAPVKKA